MLQPDFKQFSRLAREATLVPVVKSVSADLLTPVSAFLAIAEKEPHAFLLESVERGEQIGRYTFLGARPYMRVKARQGVVEIERGRRREVVQQNIFRGGQAPAAGTSPGQRSRTASIHRGSGRIFCLRRGSAVGKNWRARER